MNDDPLRGGQEATKLALACFMDGMTQSQLLDLHRPQLVAYARDHAGLDEQQLDAAVGWIIRRLRVRLNALQALRDSH